MRREEEGGEEREKNRQIMTMKKQMLEQGVIEQC